MTNSGTIVLEGVVSTFRWTVIVYFTLVFVAAMFSLSEREGEPGIWHIPKSRLKRGTLLLFITSTVLLNPFLNHPDKVSICWLIGVLAVCLAYGLTDYLKKESRNVAAFLLWFSVGCVILSVVA